MSLRFVIKMCAHRYLLCEHFACSYLFYVSKSTNKKNYYQLSKRRTSQLSQIFIRQQIISYHGIYFMPCETPARILNKNRLFFYFFYFFFRCFLFFNNNAGNQTLKVWGKMDLHQRLISMHLGGNTLRC